MIVLKEGHPDDPCCHAAVRLGGIIVKRLPLVNAVVVQGLDENAVKMLRFRYDVESVEDDIAVRAVGLGPLSNRSAGMRGKTFITPIASDKTFPIWRYPPSRGVRPVGIPWGVKRVGAPQVWKRTKGEGVRVAVVDTGIDANHPDLKDRVIAGYSAIPGHWTDENGHGTHVAGTVAASGKTGVYGVAPLADLLAVRVLDGSGGGSLSDLIDGLGWSLDHGAQVINMSLGTPRGHRLLERAVKALSARGVLVVAAAGNSGPGADSVEYPASYASVVAVAAIDQHGQIPSFSSRGPQLDVTAPGSDILSTWPPDRWQRLSGTSMAAPHVAGVAALAFCAAMNLGLLRHDSFENQEAVTRWMRKRVCCSVHRLPGIPRQAQGNGVINAVCLVDAVTFIPRNNGEAL